MSLSMASRCLRMESTPVPNLDGPYGVRARLTKKGCPNVVSVPRDTTAIRATLSFVDDLEPDRKSLIRVLVLGRQLSQQPVVAWILAERFPKRVAFELAV